MKFPYSIFQLSLRNRTSFKTQHCLGVNGRSSMFDTPAHFPPILRISAVDTLAGLQYTFFVALCSFQLHYTTKSELLPVPTGKRIAFLPCAVVQQPLFMHLYYHKSAEMLSLVSIARLVYEE